MPLYLVHHFPLTSSFPLCFPRVGLQNPPVSSHPLRARWNPSFRIFSFSSRVPAISAASTSDEKLLQGLVGSEREEDDSRSHLPAVRTYENDLFRLTLVGTVDFDQALTAAAADGGDAADEHLSSALSSMVIETVYPGSNSRGTVSTRLFLPTREVKEKSREIRSTLADDIYSGTVSRNILAMTFRQVILHRVANFKLEFFSPGAQRNMEDLSNPREISSEFSVSSENLSLIAILAEAVCSCILEHTKRTYLKNEQGKTTNFLSRLSKSPQIVSSFDSSVAIQTVPYKTGGVGFSDSLNEYRLRINGKSFKDVKFEGWKKLPDDIWEIPFTHFQMVDLADILDMYYEDQYTLPGKQFLSAFIGPVSSGSENEMKLSWKLVSVMLLSFLLLISLRIRARIHQPNLSGAIVASESVSESHQPVTLADDMPEDLYLSVVQRIQDALGRGEDVSFDRDVGAWVGVLPAFLERETLATSSEREETTFSHDIASYQVVLSREGKIVGFQPTSRTAVPHWASNPLAAALHEGKTLSPGILEPTAKIPQPQEVVLVEVLMSTSHDSWFVLARPIQ